MERMNAWEKYPEGKKRNEVFDFAEEYRKFLSRRSASASPILHRKQRRRDS